MPKGVHALARASNNRRRSSSNGNTIKMMPIGVPKVAYRVPGSPSADWYVNYLSFILRDNLEFTQYKCLTSISVHKFFAFLNPNTIYATRKTGLIFTTAFTVNVSSF